MNLKNSFLFREEEAPPETVYHDDIRALVLAHKLNARMVIVESNAQIKGLFSYYHRKLASVRKVMLGVILAMILFQKPAWCLKMGEAIDQTCSRDVEGREYNLNITTFIDPRTSFVLSFGLMYALIVLQILKIQSSEVALRAEKLKLTLQVGFFALSLSLGLL